MAQGKKYQNAARGFDRERMHAIGEAATVVVGFPKRNYDETVDMVLRLGVDPRKAEEMIRGTVSLPAGTGKAVRVAVFAQGDAAQAARDAGAEYVGAEDLAEQIEGGMLDFDVTIAAPDMMPIVGKLGRVLGPRSLMPNPKTGTVTPDVAKAVEEFKGGKVEFRTDKFANVHVPVGKVSFSEADISTNIESVVEELKRMRPAGAKGQYIKRASISTTMGPSIKLDVSSL
ncbi:MAG: large subunit ribosomal protein L1 [Verrucomicrobiales bacterium]|jgi:large subunit ribosomal protein L1